MGYDLGLVGSAEAIEIEPAEPMSLLDVRAEALEPALSLPQTGSTRRAWARAAVMHALMKDPVAEVIWARFGP